MPRGRRRGPGIVVILKWRENFPNHCILQELFLSWKGLHSTQNFFRI
jgi:hypothetical protein